MQKWIKRSHIKNDLTHNLRSITPWSNWTTRKANSRLQSLWLGNDSRRAWRMLILPEWLLSKRWLALDLKNQQRPQEIDPIMSRVPSRILLSESDWVWRLREHPGHVYSNLCLLVSDWQCEYMQWASKVESCGWKSILRFRASSRIQSWSASCSHDHSWTRRQNVCQLYVKELKRTWILCNLCGWSLSF